MGAGRGEGGGKMDQDGTDLLTPIPGPAGPPSSPIGVAWDLLGVRGHKFLYSELHHGHLLTRDGYE